MRWRSTSDVVLTFLALIILPAATVFIISAAGGMGCGLRVQRALSETDAIAAQAHWVELEFERFKANQPEIEELQRERNRLYWENVQLRARLEGRRTATDGSY